MRFFDVAYAADNLSAEAENLQTTDNNEAEIRTTEAPVTVLGEMESLRTEDEKHFRMSDGSYMAVSYGMAVHYKDENGNWQDIDNRMVLLTDQATYRTYNLESTTDFSANLTGGNVFETSHEGATVSMSLLDTAQANQIMEQYAAELEAQLEPGLTLRPGTGSNSLRTEGAELSVSTNAELRSKLQLIENTLSAGNTLLAFNRTATADTSVPVSTVVNTGSMGNNGDARVGWSIEDILPDNLQSSILYEDVFPGIDLLYTKYSHHVKEEIIVNVPQSIYRYDFWLGLDGIEAVKNKDGSIDLVNEADEVLYYIPAPFMQDDNGVISHEVEYVLTPSTDGMILSVIADTDWMNDEERVYPVTIDPTIRVSEETQSRNDMASGYVIEGLPNNAYGGANDLWIGWTQWNSLKESIAYLYIRTLPEIPAGSVVIDAGIQLYMLGYSQVGLNELAIGTYELTDDLPDTVSNYADWITLMTWNTRAGYDPDKMLDYNIVSSGMIGYDVYWEITGLVKKWYVEGTEKRCIALAIDPDVDYHNTYCANATFYGWDSTNPPIFTVTYRDQTGIEPYYTYRTMNAGHAGSAYIADATGQVKVVKNIASYASTTNPFSLNLVYNSDYFQKEASANYQPPKEIVDENEEAVYEMQLGHGWTLDILQALTMQTIDDTEYICYHDGDGTKHYFVQRDEGGLYYDEDGLGLTVHIDNSAQKQWSIYDDQGNSWTFLEGRPTWLFDADGNSFWVFYDNGKISGIVQENLQQTFITVADFTYSGDYLSSITDASGNQYNFAYNTDGTLAQIKLGETPMVSYTYSGNRLIGMTDQESGYSLQFAYDSAGRIASFEERAGQSTGYGVTVSYPNHSKTVYHLPGTDNISGTADDLYNHYLFDYAGRTVNAYTTDQGSNILSATNAVYTVDQTTTGTDKRNNRIATTGGVGESAFNLFPGGNIEGAGTTSWAITNGSVSTDNPRTGQYSLKGNLDDESKVFTAETALPALVSGQSYVLSAYVNTSEVATVAEVYLEVINTATGEVHDSRENVYGSLAYVTSGKIDDGWGRIQASFQASGEYRLRIYATGVMGCIYVDDIQLEPGEFAGAHNLLENGNMEAGSGWNTTGGFTVGAGLNASRALLAEGSPNTVSTLYQTVQVNQPGTQTYVLSGWAKANSVPDNLDTGDADPAASIQKKFGLRAELTYADGDGDVEYHYVPFHADLTEWQFASLTIVPKESEKTVSTIKVIIAYDTNANEVHFDNISLTREVAQSMTYDEDGNLKSVASVGLSEDVNTYSGGNLIESVTGGNGTFTYTYSANLLTTATDGIITQQIIYDSDPMENVLGNVVGTVLKSNNASNPLTISTSAEYTNYGNLLSQVTDPLGNTVRYEYSGARNLMYGLPSKVTDPKGVETTVSYDAYGRTTGTSIENTASVAYTYTSGNLSQIRRNDSIGSVTYHLAYDVFGNPISMSVGNQMLASYTYEANNGSLSRLTYGNGDYELYTYDEKGRIASEEHSEGREILYRYSPDDRFVVVEDSEDGNSYYTYDNLGRLSGFYHEDYGIQAKYAYDLSGRPIMTDYEIDGWSRGYEEYTYNGKTEAEKADSISDGTLTSMRMTSLRTLTFGYDYLQRLTSRSISTKLVETYTYQAGSGTNATSTLVSGKTNTLGGTIKSSFAHTYDANGNILTVTDSVTGKTVTYSYDNQNQLTSAVHSDGRIESYTYDTAGNIQTFDNGTTSHSYTYGDYIWSDLLAMLDGIPISYDGSGNPISYYNGSSYTMSWTEGRNLSSVTTGGATTTYKYDRDGIRTRKTKSDGNYIEYLVAGGVIIGEKHYDSNGSVTKHMRYIFDENGSVCGYMVSTDGRNWTDYYFIRNLQGDVLQVFKALGNTVVAEYTYDSWGKVLSATGTNAEENPFRYRGYYYDVETGFYYLNKMGLHI